MKPDIQQLIYRRIELGNVGYIHPDAKGMWFGSLESAKQYCLWEHINLNPELLSHCDTRPTIREVFDQIVGLENEYCEVDDKYSCGPWNEHFSLRHDFKEDWKWPDDYHWIAVYVVQGGSEGLYLHVSIIDREGKHKLLYLGKTLSCSRKKWEECYASAGRIAYYLDA